MKCSFIRYSELCCFLASGVSVASVSQLGITQTVSTVPGVRGVSGRPVQDRVGQELRVHSGTVMTQCKFFGFFFLTTYSSVYIHTLVIWYTAHCN